MEKKGVVLLSGGMDSVTLLHTAVALYGNDVVVAVSFDYGQRHKKELEYARNTADRLGVKHHVFVVGDLFTQMHSQCSLVSSTPVPEGHYAEESMKATVVPNRNMFMLSIAAAFAMANGYPKVWFGAHAGDHTIYPDCRPEFVDALSKAVELADWNKVTIHAPFVNLSKSEIVAIGDNLQIDWGTTWSCYNGGEEPCGKCGTCVEREEALDEALTFNGYELFLAVEDKF